MGLLMSHEMFTNKNDPNRRVYSLPLDTPYPYPTLDSRCTSSLTKPWKRKNDSFLITLLWFHWRHKEPIKRNLSQPSYPWPSLPFLRSTINILNSSLFVEGFRPMTDISPITTRPFITLVIVSDYSRSIIYYLHPKLRSSEWGMGHKYRSHDESLYNPEPSCLSLSF